MVKNSLKDYINLIKSTISPQLISEKTWININQVCQILPSAITTFFGFECRLGIVEAHADFLLCAGAKEAGRKVLGDQDYSINLPDFFNDNPVWKNIQKFSSEWNNEASSLLKNVSNIWLEFDINDYPKKTPIPSCFFAPKPIFSNTENNSDSYQWVTQTALKLLRGQPILPEVEKNLFNCFDLLPTGAYVFQIGLMLARESDYVRICIRDISSSSIISYLNQINWQGSIVKVEKLLADLDNFADRIDLDLDVGKTIHPKIGLECYLERQPKFNTKWKLFLDYLVEIGLCIPQKREALLNYTGYLRQKDHQELWPTNLSKLSRFLGSQHKRIFFKNLHHIKVVYQSEQCLEAKAYLAVTNSLMNPQIFKNAKNFQNTSIQFDNFLSTEEHKNLINFVFKKRNDFMPSGIHNYENSSIGKKENHRNSLVLFYFPEFEKLITNRIQAILPDVLKKIGIPEFPIAHIETQITAHNNNDYYKIHNDNGSQETSRRVLTFVYYFNQEPKEFTRGELKIYNTSVKNQANKVDSVKTIEPHNNSIVFFPSQYVHEVRPINCPSCNFAHSRFTINGWIWTKENN